MDVTYIAKWAAWFVTEQRGNKLIYHGPFYVERAARWYAAQAMRSRETDAAAWQL